MEAENYYYYGASHAGKGQWEQALSDFSRAVEIDPNYMNGQAKRFIEREIERLNPLRIDRMLAQAYSAMTRLAIQWKEKAINFPTKIKLYKSTLVNTALWMRELDVDLEM